MFRGVMQHQGFAEVQAVANAAVPIVKMIDARGSGLHVDICFNNMLGVFNTRSVPPIDPTLPSSTQVSLVAIFGGMNVESFVWLGQAPQDLLRARMVRTATGSYREALGKTTEDQRCIIGHPVILCICHHGHPLLADTV